MPLNFEMLSLVLIYGYVVLLSLILLSISGYGVISEFTVQVREYESRSVSRSPDDSKSYRSRSRSRGPSCSYSSKSRRSFFFFFINLRHIRDFYCNLFMKLTDF